MSKIGDRQREIIRAFHHQDSFTKKEAVKLIGGYYFYNAEKHVGDVLTRMVRSRLIERIKPGLYSTKITQPPTIQVPERSDGKCKWCGGSGCLLCKK